MTWEEIEKAGIQHLFAKPGEIVYNFDFTCIYDWESKTWKPLPLNEQKKVRDNMKNLRTAFKK